MTITSEPAYWGKEREPEATQVLEQLHRILGHRDFEASDRTRRFLRFVVEEMLAGRGPRLKGYTIAVEVFGRPTSFDASLDPIVRIQAGRLRRALEHYYLVAGGDDPIVIAVPRGAYTPVFTRNQKRTEPLPDAVAVRPKGVAIAVLPFRQLGETIDGAVLADGLSGECADMISRYPDLCVIPLRRGSTVLPDDGDYAALSRRVGARFLLEGSVQWQDDGVKIAARLIDGPQNREIWAEGYHRDPAVVGLIEIQEAVARSVSAGVASEYGLIAQRLLVEAGHTPPAELSTFEAMLSFYEYEAAPTPASTARCLAALQATVVREPEYGPVWSALSVLMHNAYLLGLPEAEDPHGRPAEYARRGARLAPRSQLARAAMAQSAYVRKETGSFLAEIELALQLNTASPLHLGAAGYMLILAGESERGRVRLEAAIDMSSDYPSWFNHGIFVYHYRRGDYVRAYEESLKAAFDIHFWGSLLRAAALGKLGRLHEAQVEAGELLALVPGFEERARDLVRRPILSEAIVDDILDGLRLAGLRA